MYRRYILIDFERRLFCINFVSYVGCFHAANGTMVINLMKL
jgi:hypothetical protein